MEIPVSKKIRIFRGEENILSLLDEYKKSGLSIKAFCSEKDIASATFHNWKKKYGRRSPKPGKPAGFAALQITTTPAVAEPALFASVKEIKLYQWVTAAYLKELLA